MDKNNLIYSNSIYLFDKLLCNVSKERKFLYLTIQREIVWFIYSVLSSKMPIVQTKMITNITQWKFSDHDINIKLKQNINIDDIISKNLHKLQSEYSSKYKVNDFNHNTKVLYSTFDIDAYRYFPENIFKNDNVFVLSNKTKFNNLKIGKKSFLLSNGISILNEIRLLTINLQGILNLTLKYQVIFTCFSASIFYSLKTRKVIERAIKCGIHYYIQSDINTYIGLSPNLWATFYDQVTITYPHHSPFMGYKTIFITQRYMCWGNLYKLHATGMYKDIDTEIVNIYQIMTDKYFYLNKDIQTKQKIKKVVVATGWVLNKDLNLYLSRNMINQILETIIQTCIANNTQVIIKSHKRSDYHELYELLENRYNNVKHISKRWYKDDFFDIDIVISLDPMSTINAQFHSMGIPVLYYTAHVPSIYQKDAALILDIVKSYSNIDLLIQDLENYFKNSELYKELQISSKQIFNNLELVQK